MMPFWIVYMSCAHIPSMQERDRIQIACRSSAGTQSATQEKKQGGGRKVQRKQGPSSSSSDKDIRELRIQKVSAFCPVQIAVRSCEVKPPHLQEADTGANVTWHPTHVHQPEIRRFAGQGL